MIRQTYQGFEISKRIRGSKFSMYVKSIYRGKINWTTDYAYAKHYTEVAAKRINAQIDEGIQNGEFDDMELLTDAEALEVIDAEEQEEERKSRTFFWNDEIKTIDNAIDHTLKCIAICSGSEYESDRIALKHFKAEYIRLTKARTKAAEEWLAIW